MCMEIGEKLREARVAAGQTQEKVAETIGVSRQTISNWENNRSYPDIISVLSLSDLYHVSLDTLLKEDQGMIAPLEESTNVVKSRRDMSCLLYTSNQHDLPSPELFGASFCQWRAIIENLSFHVAVIRQNMQNAMGQQTLARSAGANNRHYLARTDREGQVTDHPQPLSCLLYTSFAITELRSFTV